MSVAVTITVVERQIVGQQVQWMDRHDLRAVGEGSCFSEVRRKAVAHLKQRGLTVLSAGYASNKTLRILVSREPNKPLALRANTAGRMR
jgi:hypothetical protein